jgi:hypothetical protein
VSGIFFQELDHILRDDFDREVGGSLNQFRGTVCMFVTNDHTEMNKRL